jgi:hypothetical protein
MINQKMAMLCAVMDFGSSSPWNPQCSTSKGIQGTILDVDPAYSGGKTTKLTVDLTVGPSSGMTTDLFIGNEPGEKGGNTKKWFQACACVAPNADEFVTKAKAAGLKFDPVTMAVPTFKGKTVTSSSRQPGREQDPVTGVERPNCPTRSSSAREMRPLAVQASNGSKPPRAQAAAAARPRPTGGGGKRAPR